MQVEPNRLELKSAPNSFEVRILVVDDNVSHLERQARILQQEGLVVVACTSYATAVRLLELDRFDFVLLSQGGPKFEGRPVLERAAQGDPPIPVLVFTDWADMDAYVQSISLGAVDYFEKPLSPSELIAVIRRHRLRLPICSRERRSAMVGRSTQLKELKRTAEVVVPVRVEPATLRGLGTRAKGKVQELLGRCGFGDSRNGSTLERWLRAESKLLSSEAPGMVGLVQSDKAVFVDAAVQGFRAEDLEVSVEAFRVTIWGCKAPSPSENTREAGGRPLRIFHVLDLPVEVDGSKATATLRLGTLHIVLPKTGRDSKISG